MNPAATLRFRRLTSMLFAGWALLALASALYALVIPPQGPVLPFTSSFVGRVPIVDIPSPEARAAGIEAGDRVLEVDGRRLLDLVLNSRGETLSPSTANVYTIEKTDGRRLTVALAAVSPEYTRNVGSLMLLLAVLLVSFFYLAVGGAVYWNKPDRAEAWALLLFCSAVAVQLATTVRSDLEPWSVARAFANLPLVGATTFHLFTTYPIEPDWVVRYRRVRTVPYVVAFAITGLVIANFAMGTLPVWVSELAFFYGLGLSLFSLLVLATQRHRAHEVHIGDRADLMLLAGFVSFLPALVVLAGQYFLVTHLPLAFALLWLVFFPIAVGYGMLRKQLFEFRLVAKSSAAYGAASIAIAGIFAAIISFADVLVELFGVAERMLQVAFLFLAILAFNPLHTRLQRLVDGLFDRDRSRYRAAVREISEAMVSMLSLREIGDRILVAVTDTMGVQRAMVLLFDENSRVLRPSAWRGDWDEEHTQAEIPSEHPIWKHLWMRREELARSDFDEEPDSERREACWDVFDTLEVELLVPILFGVDLLGVIAVGRKLSGDRLAADDRQLLRTLANQSSIAMENAKAFDEIAQLNETLEARVEERTNELRETQGQLMQSEKMSTIGQLVAGVAHELNNPIGFVHANLQLLDEYIKKLVIAHQNGGDTEKAQAAIDKLLMRSREGTERVKKIVQNLRTFSRMDQAELQDADLHEEIDRTLGLMEPRLKGGIEVIRNYGDLPKVRCYPGQLNQVFLNLLMNACDALDDSAGTITITTECNETGVRLRFQDNGPGIPPDVQTRLFDPFFTTKDVGKGTGLGLSLSHGIIERHRGRIAISSEPGQGATFTIDLPLDATP